MIFFFKHKTAYEIRISDWSSDVCSSDLAQLVGRDRGMVMVRLSSGEQRYIRSDCMGTVGAVSNPDNANTNLAKAGRNRWLGKRPLTRGLATHPVDHPHGGGEGRPHGGRHPLPPSGHPPPRPPHPPHPHR